MLSPKSVKLLHQLLDTDYKPVQINRELMQVDLSDDGLIKLQIRSTSNLGHPDPISMLQTNYCSSDNQILMGKVRHLTYLSHERPGDCKRRGVFKWYKVENEVSLDKEGRRLRSDYSHVDTSLIVPRHAYDLCEGSSYDIRSGTVYRTLTKSKTAVMITTADFVSTDEHNKIAVPDDRMIDELIKLSADKQKVSTAMMKNVVEEYVLHILKTQT